MDASDSDKLQPPSLDGVFARKRRERQERTAPPQYVIPEPAPAPLPPEPEPTPAPTPLPAPDPIPDPIPPPSPLPTPDPIPSPEPVPMPTPAGQASSAEADIDTIETRRRADETAVLSRVIDEPEAAGPLKSKKTPKAPKAAKAPKAVKAPKTPKPVRTKPPKAAKVPRPKAVRPSNDRHVRRIPAVVPSVLAGACSGACLVGLVAAFNRWGGQSDSMNVAELLGSFVAAIIVGVALLALGRVAHRAAIAFLGVGLVAVVLMFFPSDRWQTLTGGIIVVLATAVAYVAAHAIAHEATGER